MDCLYSSGATAAPYPQYYALQLFAGKNYLGLSGGGHMAKSLTPPSGGGGLVSTAFYTPTQDALVITNPTSATYSSITLSLQNVGFQTPQATLYQVSGGTKITSSSIALIPAGAGYTVNIAVPPYSVQAISLTE